MYRLHTLADTIKVAGYIHWTVCEHVGLQVTCRECEHVSERVTVNGTAVITWDVPVITDRKTFANRTDTVLHVKWEKAGLLIDIVIPDDSNLNTEDTEKKTASKKTWRSGQQNAESEDKYCASDNWSIRNNDVGI